MLLGSAREKGKFAQHNDHFDIAEKVLKYGIEYFVKYAIRFLNK